MGLAEIRDRIIPEKTRKVIKRVISSALIVALGVLQGPSQAEGVSARAVKESERNGSSLVGFIDFNEVNPNNFIEALQIIPKLGKTNSLIFGGVDESNIFKLNLADQDKVLRYLFFSRLAGHGDMVIQTHEQILGVNLDWSKIPRFDMLTDPSTEVLHTKDRIGNEEYFIKIGTEKVDEFIDSHKDIKVFNLSLQFGYLGGVRYSKKEEVTKSYPISRVVIDKITGKERFEYGMAFDLLDQEKKDVLTKYFSMDQIINGLSEQENEEFINLWNKEHTEIIDVPLEKNKNIAFLGAFTPENPFRKQNFDILKDFASRHPDRIIVISAGNYRDVYDLGELPPNLVIACFLTTNNTFYGRERVPNYSVKGKGMICVDNKDPNFGVEYTNGTSFSAPIVSAFIRLEMLNGKSPLEAVESLKERSEKLDGNYILNPSIRRAIIREIENNTINKNRSNRNERRIKRRQSR